ncbi:MAG TPA: NAD(P)/FAD-dependent oxidoreductase [Firmicutes bacterium]|jgi:glycerol-3-phosphate dehydrogenase|nr:NAD(P)/FAD-dependent oxidoreductase [Bacillota bacterium]
MREKQTLTVDVAIVGGGIIGTAVARELSKYDVSILLVEKEAEVGWGTTKANSGIVHAGFHEEPGTLKAKYCFPGNQMYPKLCEELDVCFRRNGILMVARNQEEWDIVQKYYQRGKDRGVPVELLSKEEALALEPALSSDILGALHAPEGGSVMPFELAAALMENALQNGAQLLTNSPVVAAQVEGERKVIETAEHRIEAKVVINAAGLFADDLAQMFGDDYFTIKPRKGEEYLFDLDTKDMVTRTIFPVPTKVSKGILVIPTAEGNLMMGPTGDNIEEKEDLATTRDGFARILEGAKSLVPGINPRKIIAQFAGVRAASDRGDFIVELSPNVPGLIHLAGMESPGLTAAPAIAVDAVKLVEEAGLKLTPKEDFEPCRKPMVRFRSLSHEERDRLIKENPAYGRIICRCESVTEGEIIDAVHRGARTLDGIKFRARAGAGRCQGGFCQPLVMAIIARELGIPLEEVTKRGLGSEPVMYHAKELLTGGEGQ